MMLRKNLKMYKEIKMSDKPLNDGEIPGEVPGDHSELPTLFNTVLAFEGDRELFAAAAAAPKNIPVKNIKFAVIPKDLPKQFDPRVKEGVPPGDVAKWFVQTSAGTWETILSLAGDQAGCGSCWAFSTASQFSDVIRFNLLKRYKEKACMGSIFFHPTIICAGESKVSGSSGVVNASETSVYATEVLYRISDYYTLAFSPKISGGVKCLRAQQEWKKTIETAGYKPGDLTKIFTAGEYSGCIGCQGNMIINALILFTGAFTQKEPGIIAGAPVINDFTLHEWACLWGNTSLREIFCAPEFLEGNINFEFPKLYKADSYSYVNAKENKQLPPGVKNMEEAMMASIYNYGPITIGFNVFKSFMDFFSKKENAKKIYSGPTSGKPLGGHAVVVVGWGFEGDVPYWIMRNSWGTKWADGGYCRVRRNVKGLDFESQFGILFFNPDNDMKDYLMTIPLKKCPALGGHPELVKEMNNNCKCRCGSYWDEPGKSCKKKIGYQAPDETIVYFPLEMSTPETVIITQAIRAALTGHEPVAGAGVGTDTNVVPYLSTVAEEKSKEKSTRRALLIIMVIMLILALLVIFVSLEYFTHKSRKNLVLSREGKEHKPHHATKWYFKTK